MVEALRPYSEALYELAKDAGKVDFYMEELKALKDIWNENSAFSKALSHPQITRVQKKEWISNLFEKNLDTLLYRYLLVLTDHDKVSDMKGIYDAYVECYRDDHNIEVVKVESATKLSDEQVQSIKDMLEKKLDKKVELAISVNDELMAGIRVQTKDLVLDNTLLSRFNAMKEKLNALD